MVSIPKMTAGRSKKIFCLFLGGIILSFLVSSKKSFAWGSQGHLIIADIAYSQLSLRTKSKIEKLIEVLSKAEGIKINFVDAAIWADEIRFKNINTYNQWHYIHLPITYNKKFYLKPDGNSNIRIASKKMIGILKDKESSSYQQAWALRMLIHLIGDLHQPLHVATLYNSKFPYGDLNGLRYRLKSSYKNLHRFWDVGGGLLAYKKNKQKRRVAISQQLEKSYSNYSQAIMLPESSIDTWINESFNLAYNKVYKQKNNRKITKAYRENVRAITREQLFKAGSNLANLLNSIYDIKSNGKSQ